MKKLNTGYLVIISAWIALVLIFYTGIAISQNTFTITQFAKPARDALAALYICSGIGFVFAMCMYFSMNQKTNKLAQSLYLQ